MIQKFYLSLPVKDVARSRAFFAALGHNFDPQFTGDDAACLVITDTVSVMLVPFARFGEISAKPMADIEKTSAGLIALNLESRAAVDAHLDAAVKAGATEAHDREDLGFMYMGGFYDLDGHGWGIHWMDPKAQMPGQPA
jgi:predicted lactoylglutathione lyase